MYHGIGQIFVVHYSVLFTTVSNRVHYSQVYFLTLLSSHISFDITTEWAYIINSINCCLGDKDDKDNTDNKNKAGGRKANDQG